MQTKHEQIARKRKLEVDLDEFFQDVAETFGVPKKQIESYMFFGQDVANSDGNSSVRPKAKRQAKK